MHTKQKLQPVRAKGFLFLCFLGGHQVILGVTIPSLTLVFSHIFQYTIETQDKYAKNEMRVLMKNICNCQKNVSKLG